MKENRMILIDMPMPENCYECPLMMRCDECEGYNNRCPLDDQIDCGYVVRRGTVVIEDRSNMTLWDRPERCPLREVTKRQKDEYVAWLENQIAWDNKKCIGGKE